MIYCDFLAFTDLYRRRTVSVQSGSSRSCKVLKYSKLSLSLHCILFVFWHDLKTTKFFKASYDNTIKKENEKLKKKKKQGLKKVWRVTNQRTQGCNPQTGGVTAADSWKKKKKLRHSVWKNRVLRTDTAQDPDTPMPPVEDLGLEKKQPKPPAEDDRGVYVYTHIYIHIYAHLPFCWTGPRILWRSKLRWSEPKLLLAPFNPVFIWVCLKVKLLWFFFYFKISQFRPESPFGCWLWAATSCTVVFEHFQPQVQ